MSPSPPPAKRARLSEDAATATASLPPWTGFQPHGDFWFDDGNLIVVAKQNIAFRIYRGLLAAQSAFFADKIASASLDPTQIFDGCPVVEVTDTPEEFAHFLRVMLPKSKQLFYRRKDDAPSTFDQVAAAIRLSYKYNVEDVLTQAIGLLQERHFSPDYASWLERELHPTILIRGPVAVGVVNLARLTGVASLLPPAMYECVRLGSAILDGWRRDDGVVECLSPQDLKLCLDLRDALGREAATIFLRLFDAPPCTECSEPEICPEHLDDAREDTFSECFPFHPSLDPWDSFLKKFLESYGFCDECRNALFIRERQERHNLWGRLPDLLEEISALTPSKRPSPAADASMLETRHGQRLLSDPTTSSTQTLCGPLAGVQRHPEFWLDDGNLILVAGRETAFRIYTGLLAAQSEVFANMFAVASSSADETYEGCPVVPVYDTPTEFAHLLRVLIPKESRTFHRTSKDAPPTFDQAAALVRLAHKYDLQDVRDQALALLEEHAFPPHAPRPTATCPPPALLVEDINAIGAVALARLVDRPTLLLLPALYRCAALGSAVLGGWTRDDGHVEHLAPADLKLCMAAHRALQRARVWLLVECAHDDDPPNPGCATPAQCKAGLCAVRGAMRREEFRRPRAALDAWEVPIGERADACGMCARCRAMLEERDAVARTDAWAVLPETFGIKVAGWGAQ
ncbi:hypothetical protein GSI_12318 [Ganoderma sinense ZZ0214-1]|uniref:BTB domain-containing protein n=1 Tax=Ganoderma sinense ZZ0214-1 TaxID=1077348 RepID=A0A2G8RYH1_9APHY|nr:hypothetical protein GSI_12318 [Ganoderma sinense ZZ0214-1]